MTRAEYAALHGCEPHDAGYWGPDGVDVAGRWNKPEMRRGCNYHTTSTHIAVDGTPNQVRKISTGRKARGYASGSAN